MKIKKFYGFIALTVVLLTTSLTFFGGSRINDISVLNSSNVEALSSSESRFIFGTTSDGKDYIIDSELNTMVYFGGSNEISKKGKLLNTCIVEGTGCVLQLEAMTQSSAQAAKAWMEAIGTATDVISDFVSIVAEVCQIFI